jgi:Protein of unknown function (DUF4199)
MNDQSPSTKRTPVIFGAISGALGSIIMYIFARNGQGEYGGQVANLVPNTICFFVGLAVVFFAVKHKRDKELHGYITLGQSVTFGFFIGLVAGLVSALVMYCIFNFIDPERLAKASVELKKSMGTFTQTVEEKTNGNSKSFTNSMLNMPDFYTPKAVAFTYFFASLAYNVIFAGIVGAFLRKDPPEINN